MIWLNAEALEGLHFSMRVFLKFCINAGWDIYEILFLRISGKLIWIKVFNSLRKKSC